MDMGDGDYQNMLASFNLEGASGDDQYPASNDQQRKKKEKYQRHNSWHVQELESLFKVNPYPDERLRADLSKKLGLERENVKYWFQNRRTQSKVQRERHENFLLKQEIEKLKAENFVIKKTMTNATCNKCGVSVINGQILLEISQLRLENARLKEEVSRTGGLASASSTPLSIPYFGPPGRNGVDGSRNFSTSPLPMGSEVGAGVLGTPLPTLSGISSPMTLMGNEDHLGRSMLVDLALASMDELIKMAQPNSSLWIKSLDGRKEVLNQEEYARMCSPYITPKLVGYVTDASREIGEVMISSSSLMETLMNAGMWSEMFPSVVAKAVTVDTISSGVNGTINGALLMMHVEVQLPTPLVPVRQMNILRYCKKHADNVWAVVDVSVENGNSSMSCKRLPSGCVVQDIPNGVSKITWVDHSQYDESVVHQLYRPLVSSGIGFGAHRWVPSLKRQCEFFSMLTSSSIPFEDTPGIGQAGRRSMLKLAQRMTNYFWSGVCVSSACKWEMFHIGDNETRFMSRKYVDHPGEPLGNVISVATSVWMPVSRQMLFDFLRGVQYRGKWDIEGSKQEILYISKGQGNCVNILGACNNADNLDNENNLLCLQESWNDTSGSMIVYSPITWQSFNSVMNGEDSTCVTLLPSGFSILPCGISNNNVIGTSAAGSSTGTGGGCLLTFGLQMVLDNLQTTELDVVNGYISSTIQKIKDAVLQVA